MKRGNRGKREKRRRSRGKSSKRAIDGRRWKGERERG